MKYPNQLAAGKLVAEEMKLFHSKAGLKTLSWCVFMTIWIEALFAYFFYVSRSMDRVNLFYLLFLAALFLVYLGAVIVLSDFRKRSAPSYVTDMIYAAVAYFVSAFSAWLFFSAAWRWHFAETVSNAFKQIMRPTGLIAAATVVAVLLGYAIALLMEPKSDRLLFGNYYWPCLFLPLLPELAILLVSMAKQVSTQFIFAKLLTPLCLAILLGFTARYIVKALLFRYTLFADADGTRSVDINLPHPALNAATLQKIEKDVGNELGVVTDKAKRLLPRLKDKIAHRAAASASQEDAPITASAGTDAAENTNSSDEIAAIPACDSQVETDVVTAGATEKSAGDADSSETADSGEIKADAAPDRNSTDTNKRKANALALIEAAKKKAAGMKSKSDAEKLTYHATDKK